VSWRHSERDLQASSVGRRVAYRVGDLSRHRSLCSLCGRPAGACCYP
jgi:hypothetical protein